jgi:hypothetical protein
MKRNERNNGRIKGNEKNNERTIGNEETMEGQKERKKNKQWRINNKFILIGNAIC